MKILFIGDISGKPGRDTVKKVLPEIRQQYAVDFVIANAENSAHGRGMTRETLNELASFGIDYFTAGDHIWDQRDFLNDLYDQSLPVVRFYNYEGGANIPGKSYDVLELAGKRIVIASFSGQHFMRFSPRNPFWAVDDFIVELESRGLGPENATILIDFHAESTAEKLSFAQYLKSFATAVVGTHTHVATADARIINDRMAYVTDLGMVGPLDASLWVKFEDAIHNFKFPNRKPFTMQDDGRKIFNSVLIEVEDNKAISIKRVDKIID